LKIIKLDYCDHDSAKCICVSFNQATASSILLITAVMIVISMLFKSESSQMTFMNLDFADCNFCIHNDELLVSYHHRTWVICVDANSQMSELTIKFQTLEVKSTFESKNDINKVSCILCMHQRCFFSFLRKHSYILVL